MSDLFKALYFNLLPSPDLWFDRNGHLNSTLFTLFIINLRDVERFVAKYETDQHKDTIEMSKTVKR